MHVFLDLDGTLIDPKPGITGSFAYALSTMGLPIPPLDELTWIIGPALIDSFRKIGVDDPDRALELYRERYSESGLFEARVYDGIAEVLVRLQELGCELYLATAKPLVFARRITNRLGLSEYLSGEFGPELDGTRNDKGELLAFALSSTGIDPANSVMVGDRMFDIDAATFVGMTSIAVNWGYGAANETDHADYSCNTPSDLPDAVLAALNGNAS